MKSIVDLKNKGALFVLNDSGGKDSQAMKIVVRSFIPDTQILVIHAHLPEVEHPGTERHARLNSQGLTFQVVQAQRKLLDMIRERGKFPSPECRQCTSDLKRGPIEKAIRHYIKKHNLKGLVVNCIGIRAEESSKRAKAIPFKFNKRNSKAGREWYDWLPIHKFTLEMVWDTIRKAGQEPHPVYAKGMTRLSCCFCIMGSKADLTLSAKLYPDLYSIYVNLEKSLGFTMQLSSTWSKTLSKFINSPKWLEETTGIKARDE